MAKGVWRLYVAESFGKAQLLGSYSRRKSQLIRRAFSHPRIDPSALMTRCAFHHLVYRKRRDEEQSLKSQLILALRARAFSFAESGRLCRAAID